MEIQWEDPEIAEIISLSISDSSNHTDRSFFFFQMIRSLEVATLKIKGEDTVPIPRQKPPIQVGSQRKMEWRLWSGGIQS